MPRTSRRKWSPLIPKFPRGHSKAFKPHHSTNDDRLQPVTMVHQASIHAIEYVHLLNADFSLAATPLFAPRIN